MRLGVAPDLRGCARENDFAPRFAAFRTEVDDPVARCYYIEVVFDHEQRMSRLHQAPERTQEFGDVLEMQTGRRLIEQEQ